MGVFVYQNHPTCSYNMCILLCVNYASVKWLKVKERERESLRERERENERELQVDILHTNRPQVDFQMCISKLFGPFVWGPCYSPMLWKSNFPFWEWTGENCSNWFDQQALTCLYLKGNQFEHSITAGRSCLAWRDLPSNAITHNSVSNEIVVTEAEQKYLLGLFALTNSQTGLGAQSYLWKAPWSTELIEWHGFLYR